MMTKQTTFILAIALQVFIIFAIIIFKVSILSSGTDVLLTIVPVDPRDMLRGDYVTFQYDISNLDTSIYGGQQWRNGDTVYVLLGQSGKSWYVQSVQKTKPQNGAIALKGKVVSGGQEVSSGTPFQGERFGNSRVHIVYGIEEYFIPEGKGQGFSFWNKKATARVAVDENGNAVLKQIYVDDKPWP